MVVLEVAHYQQHKETNVRKNKSKMEKINEQRFPNAKDDITPSVISIEIGKNKIKTLTFKVGNS